MVKENISTFSVEIFEKLGLFIATAFGLVAAFAWREAFVAIYEQYFGKDPNIDGLLIYAITVSLVGIIATIVIAKAASKVKKMTNPEPKKDHDIIR